MRRIIAIVFVLTLTLCLVSFADTRFGIDFSNLSLQDLVELKVLLAEEIRNREIQITEPLYPGQYAAGIDFEEGHYVINCVECLNGASVGHLSIESIDGDTVFSTPFSDGYTYYFDFENGMTLKVKAGLVVLTSAE